MFPEENKIQNFFVHRIKSYKNISKALLLLLVLCVVFGIFAISERVYESSINIMLKTMPSDFNFVMAYGYDQAFSINTFNSSYTKPMPNGFSRTGELKLTKAEMAEAYKILRSINIVNYERDFNPPGKAHNNAFVEGIPSYPYYYFKIQYGNTMKEVYWQDTTHSTAKEARKLRGVVEDIHEIISKTAAYRNIPGADYPFVPTGGL